MDKKEELSIQSKLIATEPAQRVKTAMRNKRITNLKGDNQEAINLNEMFATGAVGEPLFDKARVLSTKGELSWQGFDYLTKRFETLADLPDTEYTKLAAEINKYRELGYYVGVENIFLHDGKGKKFKGNPSELRKPVEKGFYVCNVEPKKNNLLTTEDFLRQIDFNDETGPKSIDAIAAIQDTYDLEKPVREAREIEYYEYPFQNEILKKAGWKPSALHGELKKNYEIVAEKTLNGAIKVGIDMKNAEFFNQKPENHREKD